MYAVCMFIMHMHQRYEVNYSIPFQIQRVIIPRRTSPSCCNKVNKFLLNSKARDVKIYLDSADVGCSQFCLDL